MKQWLKCFGIFMGLSGNALAQQTAHFGWEQTAAKITDSLTGPMAYSLSIVAIAICGLLTMFGDLQSGARKAATVGLGISILIGSTQLLTTFFGFSGVLIR